MQNLSKEKLWELIHNYTTICSNHNNMEYMTDKEEQDQRNEEKNALDELNTFIDSLYSSGQSVCGGRDNLVDSVSKIKNLEGHN